MLPLTTDALQLHLSRANHQAGIWIQANKEVIQTVNHIDTLAWKKESSRLSIVWTRLPAVPDACLQLVMYGCKSKCNTSRCSCFKKAVKCMPASGCDAVNCRNPVGQEIINSMPYVGLHTSSSLLAWRFRQV